MVDELRAARLYSAAGNRFVVLDAFEHEPADPGRLARELCAEHDVDGLLLAARPRAGGDCRMLVFNRDGSRAQACGNGLRCIARWSVEEHGAPDALVIETDAGPRRVSCRRASERAPVGAARTELGVPRVLERNARLAIGAQLVEAVLVDMGNPHCILFVADVERADVAGLGPRLERHERFPERTNVSFVELRAPELLRVRTFERGVGETAACGTGVGASAAAALVLERARSPVAVETRGGRLEVEWDGRGPLSLTGPVEAWVPVRA